MIFLYSLSILFSLLFPFLFTPAASSSAPSPPCARRAAAARSMRSEAAEASPKRSAPMALPSSVISSEKGLTSASKAIRKLASAPCELCQ